MSVASYTIELEQGYVEEAAEFLPGIYQTPGVNGVGGGTVIIEAGVQYFRKLRRWTATALKVEKEHGQMFDAARGYGITKEDALIDLAEKLRVQA